MSAAATNDREFYHRLLDCGVELAVDRLEQRDTVALCLRMLVGVVDDPPDLVGISSIVEQTLSKGTRNYDGRALADAFDALGAEWATSSGRQTTLLRVVCLPEFVLDVVELAAEMFCRPTFPDEACQVAVQLAIEELRHMEDDPHALLRRDLQRITLGPLLGRHPDGHEDTLPNITPEKVRQHWRNTYHAGRLQVAAAGPIEPQALAARLERCFAGLGRHDHHGRRDAEFVFAPARHHRPKQLEQQYIGLTLPGAPRGSQDFAAERVMIGVLSGGMSARLFTEVREKQGLVYWVAAWSEQPRGSGVIHVGASTTPENCQRTFDTIMRELRRLPGDLTDEETRRARDGLIAHLVTEDDLTRARAGGLSDDLFYFSRPVGLDAHLAELRAVTRDDVARYAARVAQARPCIATVGPIELATAGTCPDAAS